MRALTIRVFFLITKPEIETSTGPRDLYKKIKDDLLILESSHQDTKAAFNFFVTIEHLPDWLGQRHLVRDNCILRVISHIANGAKHFHLNDKRHSSVINTENIATSRRVI
jgi:hypothetical protein